MKSSEYVLYKWNETYPPLTEGTAFEGHDWGSELCPNEATQGAWQQKGLGPPVGLHSVIVALHDPNKLRLKMHDAHDVQQLWIIVCKSLYVSCHTQFMKK